MAFHLVILAVTVASVIAQDTRDPRYDNICEVLLTRFSYLEQNDVRLEQQVSEIKQENERLRQIVTASNTENQRLQQLIQKNENSTTQQTEVNSRLHDRFAQLEGATTRQNAEIIGQEDRIAQLESTTTRQNAENIGQEDRIAQLESTTEGIDALDDVNNRLEERITQLEDANEAVGFTAYATTKAYTYDETVLFPSIVTNLGGHYNAQNSTFTCPVTGTYLFSVNFNSDRGRSMGVHIVKDGSTLVNGWADDISDVSNHASAFVITTCNAGHSVWPRTAGSGHIAGGTYSHFSGYLLNRDN